MDGSVVSHRSAASARGDASSLAGDTARRPGRRMRIFFVCQRVPFPPDRGDKITTFNEIVHLSRAHDVHVYCLADGTADLANVAKASEHAVSVEAAAVSSWGTKWRALLAFFLGGPLSVASYRASQLHRKIKQAHARQPPDLIIVYSGNVAQYAVHFPDVPRIMQFADLDSLKWGQYSKRSRGLLRWVYGLEQRRLLAYERAVAHSFDHSLVCTDVERRDFEELIPGAPVSVVANGVDLAYFKPRPTRKDPASVVFTGVMDYLANIDAVTWFCAEILPLIRRKVPGVKFVICGSRPTDAVRELATIEGVTVTGWVPDTRPFLDAAEVFVAPLRMARGVQNKVLEGLASGLPCVCSVPAWSGTVIPQGQGIVATDDAAEFADHVVRLLSDGVHRDEMARRARRSAELHYTWQAQLERFDAVIDAVVSRRQTGSTERAKAHSQPLRTVP